MNQDFHLSDIMRHERISTFFQPIVNLKTGEIFAYEALTRGVHATGNSLIQPCDLFARADQETCSLEFDRLCRKKALENFRKFKHSTNALMFMNINTAVVSSSEEESPHIGIISQQMGFDPSNIGLELIESKANSSKDLIDFVNLYRNSGFLIIIDDFGCEHSNINRLIQVQPDIIKVDRSIITNIEKDPYRQSILKSIHSLAAMTGSLCLAEGVETLEEIKTCHLLGVDLFQGFAIACPSPDISNLEKATMIQVRTLQKEIHRISIDALRKKRRLTGDINQLADWLIRQIDTSNPDSLTLIFQEFIAMNQEIECVYLLNSQGIQISKTITSPFIDHQTRPSIFYPAHKDADHSLKSYFICFEALGIERYLTDVYLSFASGNLCRTFSVQLPEGIGPASVLCMDFLEEPIRSTSLRPLFNSPV